MKKVTLSTIAIILSVFFSSCGINGAYVFNHNDNSTQVHLKGKNYKTVDKVSGSAEVSYVLIFGGMKKRQLYQNAYADMMDKSDLMSGSRALINMVTEEHVGGVPPFYYTRTLTVSANVIEFTE